MKNFCCLFLQYSNYSNKNAGIISLLYKNNNYIINAFKKRYGMSSFF
ncbi:MAG TPA: hypothetical protein VF008_30230 [Niastella sp.]